MFVKYPSIKNYYNARSNRNVLSELDSLWFSSEKLHGGNVSMILLPDKTVEFSNRSIILDENTEKSIYSYYKKGINQLLSDQELIDSIYSVYELYPDAISVNAYGEMFGTEMQNMEYRVDVDTLFFNIFVIDKNKKVIVLSRKQIETILPERKLVKVKKLLKLSNFIDEDVDTDSSFGGFSEGDVFQPYDETYLLSNGFKAIKKKTERFNEIKKVKVDPTKELRIQLRQEIEGYITLNRLENIISHGEIPFNQKEIGRYIQLMKDDIVKEFTSDLDYSDELFVTVLNKTSGEIAKLIKSKLSA